MAIALGVALTGTVVAHTVFAQNRPAAESGQAHDHGAMPSHGSATHAQHTQAMHGMASSAPTMPGQDAFGAIAEIVRILDADPATDWTKVDIERLRQHLIDMNEVVLRSVVKQTPVSGGLAMEVTGTGRTEQAIRAMVVPHAVELDRMPSFAARTETVRGGVRLTVVARKPDDAKLVARLRGLGFAGLITEGAHHQPHHLAMAKGEALNGHTH
ncbi:MAG: hypothetical protein HYS77_03335 [Candidatus Rokubacteria bacterium]|nr:hypothetical protein [Candidatus Rokubacteria bacterium]